MDLNNKDKEWAKSTFSRIIESISLLISLTGCIVMILQGFNQIEWPHGLIAGLTCMSFGFGFFCVEKLHDLLKLIINKKKESD